MENEETAGERGDAGQGVCRARRAGSGWFAREMVRDWFGGVWLAVTDSQAHAVFDVVVGDEVEFFVGKAVVLGVDTIDWPMAGLLRRSRSV